MKQAAESIVLLVGTAEDAELLNRLAARLQADGISARPWTPVSGAEDSASQARDNIASARALVVAMSQRLINSDWPWLEQVSLLFRDCPEGDMRFVPLLLEECVLPETARRFRPVPWAAGDEGESYDQLLVACRSEVLPAAAADQTVQAAGLTEKVIEGHYQEVWSIITSASGDRVITGGGDGAVKVWDAESWECLATFSHGEPVYGVATSRDGKRVASAAGDGTIKIWDVERMACSGTLAKHRDLVYAVALAPDDRTLASASGDKTVRVWDLDSGECLWTLKGHANEVCSVAFTPDGQSIVSGSVDGTVRVWDLNECRRQGVMRGHTHRVNRIAFLQQGGRMATGSDDGTVRIWDMANRRCVATIEGHPGDVLAVAASLGGSVMAAVSANNQHSPSLIKLWDVNTGACLATVSQGTGRYAHDAEDRAFFSLCFARQGDRLFVGCKNGTVISLDLGRLALAQRLRAPRPEVRYTNAKVVLVGESGVGKSGLALRLTEGRWEATESTHGMRVWPLRYPGLGGQDIDREVWLWDLAGQPEYRLIHQLFLDETGLALVLYDGSRPDDPFYGIRHWEEALRVAVGYQPAKLLVAARVDRGGPRLTSEKLDGFCKDHSYGGHAQTSALTGEGCDALREKILDSIPWDRLPWTATTRLFKTLQDAVVRLRGEGRLLLRHAELHQHTRLLHPNEAFGEAELRAVVGLMAGQGLVKELSFGDFILLQPEQISNYGAAVIRAARRHQDGIGCISEAAVLGGTFDVQDLQRVDPLDETILLRALVQHFIDQSLCLKEATADGAQLIFPSQFNREMPDAPAPPPCTGAYRFRGHADTVFTTLVVRMTYSDSFGKGELWKNAASFRTPAGRLIGVSLARVAEGEGEVRVFAEAEASEDLQALLHQFVNEHLMRRAADVRRERQYVCTACSRPVRDAEAVRFRVAQKEKFIRCSYCDDKITLMDAIERNFGADDTERRAYALDQEAERKLDNESKDLILVGEAISIAGQAGQIYRPVSMCDHGIDGEIEFKNRSGRATGRRVYLQLKSGDSYLYERKSDGEEIFTVKKRHHIEYWQSQEYPVYLVQRSSDGEIRWMDISRHLAERKDKDSLKIIFTGEVFNSYTLNRLRNETLQEDAASGVRVGSATAKG